MHMTTFNTGTSIDEYLRERLMPVEGAIPRIPGIEMFGNSIPAGTVGGPPGNAALFIECDDRCGNPGHWPAPRHML